MFARGLDLPYNKQELTVNLAAAGSFYQKLVQAIEGYAGAAPIIHQAVAIKAAIDALDAAFQEDRAESFSGGVAREALPALLGSLEPAQSGALRSEALPGRAR